MRVPLIATRNLTYATRQLKAEDAFEAVSRTDARILLALKKARRAAQGAPKADANATSDIAELRAEYTDVVGKRPYHAWDEATLREKIADAKDEA